jgi:hypothetical protein
MLTDMRLVEIGAVGAAAGLLATAVLLVYRLIAYCLADLAEARVVRGLSRDGWRLLILFWIPFGAVLYLRYGRLR